MFSLQFLIEIVRRSVIYKDCINRHYKVAYAPMGIDDKTLMAFIRNRSLLMQGKYGFGRTYNKVIRISLKATSLEILLEILSFPNVEEKCILCRYF